MLILKYVGNLSDENLVAQWTENNYFQYFSGEQYFQLNIPCVPTELIAFRKRIGNQGEELILEDSIRVNEPVDGTANAGVIVSVDTTVQERNITYALDDKLYKKMLDNSRKRSY